MRLILALVAAFTILAAPITAHAQATRFTVMTDGSGTVTTGGTSKQVFPVSTDRAYLMCQNPIDAIEPLFINFGSPASTSGGSIEIAAGGSISFIGVGVPTTAVFVTATTTGHRYICKSGGNT